ncbi:14225_t:CDS:2 [Ambispora leptoticha]|uniref:14225_t:CDS:1 n=1 Tax=Ambispora leptoticha TaxID=144679 RepID=A0A9N9DMC2_9GLOM|nr:14225_t:CDS:2 [Ambispora leptoticha]
MSVCSTDFYWHVVFKKPWPNIPSLKELCYAKCLETDVIKESFGLKDALTNEMFFQEFSSFQQIEGLFNKWDLKTHPNMTNSTQQAKMRLA